jgi:threonine/homoserine/homoserine lactone efflux protein
MLPTRHLAEFLITVYVVILIPGPSVLFVVSRGVALGRRAALATVAGDAGGFLLQLVLVSIGVGSLVARSDAVFSALKLIGAAYLVLLGVRKIRERKALAGAIGGSSRRLERLTGAGGVMLIGLGVGLALTGRKN